MKPMRDRCPWHWTRYAFSLLCFALALAFLTFGAVKVADTWLILPGYALVFIGLLSWPPSSQTW